METVENKAYELRALCADDVFPVLTILKKVGIKEFKSCFESPEVMAAISQEKVDVEAVGITVVFDIATIIIGNLPSCREDIYAFLSGLSGMKKEEIAALPMLTFTEMIVDVVKKDEFKGFMKVVSKLLNK
jgi:hypothetical protein